MAEKKIVPDIELARNLLDEFWQRVSQEKEGEINPDIDRLIDSRFVSIRFCLPTQLLGKLAAPELDCLCLQKGDATFESQWDPRSFANKVIVPWVAENQSVLGTSTDPYVSKPLRKARIEEMLKGKRNGFYCIRFCMKLKQETRRNIHVAVCFMRYEAFIKNFPNLFLSTLSRKE